MNTYCVTDIIRVLLNIEYLKNDKPFNTIKNIETVEYTIISRVFSLILKVTKKSAKKKKKKLLYSK